MAAVDRRARYSKAHPCPVCGGFEAAVRGQGVRCGGFLGAEDERGRGWPRCTREERAGGLALDDSTAPPSYRHMLGGRCDCGVEHAPAPARATSGAVAGIEAIYQYRDESLAVLYEVVRKLGKKFLQRRSDGAGGWIWSLGDTRRVLYRLPELLEADPAAIVYIVEGEKDVAALVKRGHVATCNPGGAGKWGAVAALAQKALSGRAVVVIADADEVGRKHARQVAASLEGHAASVRLVEAEGHKDAADLLAAGGSLEMLVALPEATAPALRAVEPEETPRKIKLVPRDDRPEVQITIELHDVVDATVAVLPLDRNLYTRETSLVTVIRAEGRTTGRSPIEDGAPLVREVEAATLLERLSRVARFVEFHRGSESWKRKAPPKQVIAAVAARGHWPKVPPLVAVSEAPVMRPDGSIHQSAGYDPATGYLLAPSIEYPAVPVSPKRDDARAALASLAEVFRDFPYVSDAARAVPIACLLTLLARSAIDGACPGYVFEASTRGSGKSLQSDAISMIVTGRAAARANYTDDDDEQQKVLSGYALFGSPLICLDNVPSGTVFGGGAIDRTLTARDAVEFRILGQTRIERVRWRAILAVNGNNISLGSDTSRRVLVSRLEPQEERPELRPESSFLHPDLVRWIQAERGRLVAAALTVLRAYVSYGRPDCGCERWGSFEEWSRLIPHAIVFAGGADPMIARPKDDSEYDDKAAASAILLRDLYRLTEADPLTARGILERLYPAPQSKDGREGLRDALETLAPPPRGTSVPAPGKLGYVLRALVGRVLGGYVLRRDGEDKAVGLRWRVHRV